MRQAMGVAVFAGMIGVTMFGIFLTPVFYVLLRGLTGNKPFKQHGEAEAEYPIQPRHELPAPTSSTRGRELAKAE
jgi:multidrug efflux pump